MIKDWKIISFRDLTLIKNESFTIQARNVRIVFFFNIY